MIKFKATKLLTRDEEHDLSRIIQAGKNSQDKEIIASGIEARNKLVEANLRLAVATAKRYSGRGLLFDDLVAEASAALIRAADKYLPGKARFSTYATFWIRNFIQRMITYNTLIHIPNHVHRNKRKPSEACIEAANSIKYCGDNGLHRVFDKPLVDNDYSQLFASIDSLLRPREKRIIELRFGLTCENPMSLSEIGKIMNGISRERIRQIQAGAMKKLRKGMAEQVNYFFPDY